MKKIIFSFSIIVFILCIYFNQVKCGNIPYSIIKIYIINETLKCNSPINIWFNDSLILSKEVVDYYNLRYKLFSKGNLKITAKINGFDKTRTEYAINIMNDSCYNIIIKFKNAKYAGSIFSIKKTDGIDYYPYFEENILTDNKLSEKYFAQEYSSNHLLLYNNTFKISAPVKIWINDQLIINKDILSLSAIYCKLFTEGKIKISAQLGDLINTKTENEFEISNKDINYIKIYFQNKKKKGIITLLDQEEGSKILKLYKEKWKLSELTDFNSDMMEESITNPIPFMIDNNTYIALQEQFLKNENIISVTNDEYQTNIQQDSIKKDIALQKAADSKMRLTFGFNIKHFGGYKIKLEDYYFEVKDVLRQKIDIESFLGNVNIGDAMGYEGYIGLYEFSPDSTGFGLEFGYSNYKSTVTFYNVSKVVNVNTFYFEGQAFLLAKRRKLQPYICFGMAFSNLNLRDFGEFDYHTIDYTVSGPDYTHTTTYGLRFNADSKYSIIFLNAGLGCKFFLLPKFCFQGSISLAYLMGSASKYSISTGGGLPTEFNTFNKYYDFGFEIRF